MGTRRSLGSGPEPLSGRTLQQLLDDLVAHGALGASSCIVDRTGVRWEGESGVSDPETEALMSAKNTILNIGSISKLITGTAVMQLAEVGDLDLDEPVDATLGHPVRNPRWPHEAVTARQLLTHSSSIKDGSAWWASYAPGDPMTELRDWIRDYLTPTGALYDPRESFYDWIPGSTWSYSNVAFGVLGALVEATAGVSFRSFTREAILDPLGMSSTGWFLADVDSSRMATLFDVDDEDLPEGILDTARAPIGSLRALVPYGFATYPDGLLRTTASDLARFAQTFLANEPTILDEATFRRMTTDALDHSVDIGTMSDCAHTVVQGLAWRGTPVAGAGVWGHDGSDPGLRTSLVVDLDTGLGVTLLTIAGRELPTAKELLDVAARQLLRAHEKRNGASAE